MADFAALRRRMVDTQLVARGIRHPAVLRAMAAVPRERFVPELDAPDAYEDSALPIGHAQTISQPYIVALMLEAIAPRPTDRVLEIGTGSGYATAVLAEVVAEVYTVERLATLVATARTRLAELGYRNVHVLEGDGSLGWPEHAPYDGIVVTAGGPDVPAPLPSQLRVGGHLVVPVGPTRGAQELVRVTRRGVAEYARESLGAVAFVPLIGEAGWSEPGPRRPGAGP
jgi:protein-L-isoaspartate(D-aspartate) O-methyltransferase